MKKKKEVNDVHAVWDAAKKKKAFRTYAGWQGKPAPPIDDGKPNHWIDHHKTAIEAYEQTTSRILGLRRVGAAACELTWQEMFPGATTPLAVTLLGRWDVWD